MSKELKAEVRKFEQTGKSDILSAIINSKGEFIVDKARSKMLERQEIEAAKKICDSLNSDTPFILNKITETGEIERFRLDDTIDVTFSAFCVECHKEMIFTGEEFLEEAADGITNFFGGVFCCCE